MRRSRFPVRCTLHCSGGWIHVSSNSALGLGCWSAAGRSSVACLLQSALIADSLDPLSNHIARRTIGLTARPNHPDWRLSPVIAPRTQCPCPLLFWKIRAVTEVLEPLLLKWCRYSLRPPCPTLDESAPRINYSSPSSIFLPAALQSTPFSGKSVESLVWLQRCFLTYSDCLLHLMAHFVVTWTVI